MGREGWQGGMTMRGFEARTDGLCVAVYFGRRPNLCKREAAHNDSELCRCYYCGGISNQIISSIHYFQKPGLTALDDQPRPPW